MSIAARGALVASLISLTLAACRADRREPPKAKDSTTVAARSPGAALTVPETWAPPPVDSTPDDPFEVAVYRGLALLTHTRDSLPKYVGANLNCTSCHLDEGRRPNSAPLAGVYARYPRFIDRAAAVVPLEDRVNYCFTRSLAGSKLPNDSREMQDMLAYLAFLSRGVPMGSHLAEEGMPRMPTDLGDTTRGAEVYRTTCARCHGADGGGMLKVPALWGPKSYSVGASMARQERAASFVRHNMPFDKPGTLTDREAYDVAAYITSKPRPDMPNKAHDWPFGGAPSDVPYDTKGHRAFRPPPLLPRANPASGSVPPPRPASDEARR